MFKNLIDCSHTHMQVEMRTAERRSKENVKAMESRHNLEMSRIKQVLFDYLIIGVDVVAVVALRIK